MLTTEDLEELKEYEPEALLAAGFEAAYVGYTSHQPSRPACAVYDYGLCVELLMTSDSLTVEEAIEHMEFNGVGAWVGPHTPLFLWKTHSGSQRGPVCEED